MNWRDFAGRQKAANKNAPQYARQSPPNGTRNVLADQHLLHCSDGAPDTDPVFNAILSFSI